MPSGANVEQLKSGIPAELYDTPREGEDLDILLMATSSASAEVPQMMVSDHEVVQIIYTSGTTSDPKGGNTLPSFAD